MGTSFKAHEGVIDAGMYYFSRLLGMCRASIYAINHEKVTNSPKA